MFALSSDGNVNQDNKVYQDSILRGEARKHFDDWVIATTGAATERQVIIVATKQRAGNVINVIWDEIDWKDGRKIAARRVNGDLTLAYVAPKTTGDVVENKTGLFLTNILFSEEK